MKHSLILIGLTLGLSTIVSAQQTVSGDSVIRAPFGGSEIVITTTSRVAGAIHSLTWNDEEFINSADHGRQLQSASNFDFGSKFTGETFNPTEAGSRFDGAGRTSTSRLLHLVAKNNQLQTTNQMAFWLRPGDKSGPNLAKNTAKLSNHLLTKRVTISFQDLPNVIQYNVTFGVPIGERHTYGQFEAVTGYMPPKFSQFLALNLATSRTERLSNGPGEQRHPVVFSTPSGSHAMGIFSPDQPSQGFEGAGYGRWNFAAQRVVKWNCVFRVRDKNGLTAGDYSFRTFVVVGQLDTVVGSIKQLHRRFRTKIDTAE